MEMTKKRCEVTGLPSDNPVKIIGISDGRPKLECNHPTETAVVGGWQCDYCGLLTPMSPSDNKMLKGSYKAIMRYKSSEPLCAQRLVSCQKLKHRRYCKSAWQQHKNKNADWIAVYREPDIVRYGYYNV